jgi:hypothetical protein
MHISLLVVQLLQRVFINLTALSRVLKSNFYCSRARQPHLLMFVFGKFSSSRASPGRPREQCTITDPKAKHPTSCPTSSFNNQPSGNTSLNEPTLNLTLRPVNHSGSEAGIGCGYINKVCRTVTIPTNKAFLVTIND